MGVAEVLERLRGLGRAERREGMARFGIRVERALGVQIPELRGLAKQLGRNRELAHALWDSGFHEARILASMLDDPKQVDLAQMERWVLDFDSWDLCDQCCMNLFGRSPLAWEQAKAWSRRPEEFVKRAGFVLMARLAVTEKKAPDAAFLEFFPHLLREAHDHRIYVKKAVNWALRQMGKRGRSLHAACLSLARDIAAQGSPSARWIAADALRELESAPVKARLKK